jgi:hypothetical protein
VHPLSAYLNQAIWALVGAAPWLAALFLGGAFLTWSPVGRFFVRYLKERGRNDALLEANNAELAELTRALSVLAERLDSTEQLLLRVAQSEGPGAGAARPLRDPSDEVRTPTPH